MFAPGETKYYLFDFFIGRSPTQYVNVGEFLLFGTFDHARSAALEVRIGP